MYAVIVLAPTQLTLNVYRINRLTHWDIGRINILTLMIGCILVIGGTVQLKKLTKKGLKFIKAKYWTVILWIPYFFMLNDVFNHLFPLTYGGNRPNPATRLLIIGRLFIFRLYVFVLNDVSTYMKQQMKKRNYR